MGEDRPIIDVDLAEIEAAFERIQQGRASAEDYDLVKRVIDNYVELTRLLREQNTTIARLRRLFGLQSSEKTADVLKSNGVASGRGQQERKTDSCGASGQSDTTPATEAVPSSTGAQGAASPSDATTKSEPAKAAKKRTKGHGRRPWTEFPDAPCVDVLHELLRPGMMCPICGQGKLYDMRKPAPIIRISGQPPLFARCWLCQVLRCKGCGHLFTARIPIEAQGPKYDESAVTLMIVSRYGMGVPHFRQEKLQGNLRVPVAASTMWQVINEAREIFQPLLDEMCRQAAQSPLLQHDDSSVRILGLMGKRRADLEAQGTLENPDRTGLFTTAIVATTTEQRQIVLYFSGRQHAGENMADLLKKRDKDLGPPVLLSDASSRNVPEGHEVVEANCIAHGRRHICDEVENYPNECALLLGKIARVYRIEKLCRRFALSPEQRLRVHQKWSGPRMDEIRAWCKAALDEKRVEPNCDMGKALKYFLNHWNKLTLFLRRPGVPLDNNLTETLIKPAILHRKNSLFFRTTQGAETGDLFLSIIETALLNDANVFDYLTEIQLHAKAVRENPKDWMPWNYNLTIMRLEYGSSDPPNPSRTYHRIKPGTVAARLEQMGRPNPRTTLN
jgi:hypothetical protein